MIFQLLQEALQKKLNAADQGKIRKLTETMRIRIQAALQLKEDGGHK